MVNKTYSEVTTVKVGDLVSIDAYRSPWIPARVVGYSDGRIMVKTTAARPGYTRGETFDASPGDCVPRGHIHVTSGHYRIHGTWTFEGLAAQFQPKWATPAETARHLAAQR